jgi:tRNA-specific 2-thiouridylase
MKKKILAAMSGGVDSSAAAILLQEQGYEVVGATVKMFGNKDVGIKEPDAPKQDVEDAKAVAEKLGIEHHVLDFSSCFKKCVINHFVNEYKCGRTPNPCVDCNKHIKFGKLFEAARELGCEYLATGHYARIEYSAEKDRWLLARGDDASKDQSYMLFNMTQDQLAHTVLPLAELTKAEIRAKADEAGLAVAHKSDSQDICFVPDGDYASFIENELGEKYPAGVYVDEEGNVLGKHKGVIHYTIGQRKGLGISMGRHIFVTKKDAATNTVTLADEDRLFTNKVVLKDINLIPFDRLDRRIRVKAKIRYRQPECDAYAEMTGEDEMTLTFDEPQRAPAKGQSAVMYDGDYVIGGGIIQ